MNAKIPAPTPQPTPNRILGDERDLGGPVFVIPNEDDLHLRITLLASSLGRRFISTAKDMGTSTSALSAKRNESGNPEQLPIPASPDRTTAHILKKLDGAHEAYAAGDLTAAKELLGDAERIIDSNRGSPYRRAAESLVKRSHEKFEEDAVTRLATDILRVAPIAVAGVAAGIKMTAASEGALNGMDKQRRAIPSTSPLKGATDQPAHSMISKVVADRVVDEKVDSLTQRGEHIKQHQDQSVETTAGTPRAKPSAKFLSLLSPPAPTPKRRKLPTPWEDER